ncbi:MAG: ABC transporter substrate-binding protein, partial [Bacteroidetes bacterium]|nr:ABC transporter substrate-binding protein [Bacteroidota bacterium]
YAADLETMWIINQLYDGLVQLDQNLEIQSCLAQSWNVAEDGLSYTFLIRKNVPFHPFEGANHRMVTAHDFVFSFNRILSKETASPGQWIFENVRDQQPFEALSDSVLVIHLKRPQGSFLQMLTTSYANAVLPEAVKKWGPDFRQHPIGTGPFQLAFWEDQVSMVLHKNQNYWMHDILSGQSLPHLDAVQIDFLKDAFAEYQGFLSGKYDFMSGIDAAYIDQLLSPDGELKTEWKTQLRLERTPFIKTDFIGFYLDGTKRITQDLRYRKMLSMSVDRNTLCSKMRNNIILPANEGFVSPQLKSSGKPHPYLQLNIPQALNLKKELEKDWGTPLPKVTITVTPEYADIFEYLQHAWGQLGIPISIATLQSGSFKEKVAKGQIEVFRKNWLADYPDGENFLQVFTQELFSPNGPNYTHYTNPTWEEAYRKTQTCSDADTRKRAWQQLDSLVINDLPIVPLYHDQVMHFVSNKIDLWSINAINMLDLTHVKKHQ